MYYTVWIGKTMVSKIRAASPTEAIKRAIDAAEYKILNEEIEDVGAEIHLNVTVREYVL